MTGLDSIINEIMNDAQQSAKAIISKAEAESTEIIKNAKNNADLLKKQADIELFEACKSLKERNNSAIELESRKNHLSAKQDIITTMLDKALLKLKNIPDNEYFNLLLKMIKTYSNGEFGEVALSKKDKERMPSDFEKKLDDISDGKLKISDDTRKIDGGFILIYKGIEENCSFDAMFKAKDENLRDRISEMLFN